MHKNRNISIFIIICILFLVLTARLLYLQMYDGDKLAKAASAQRTSNARIENSRGNIVDRNGIPFTNRSEQVVLVLKPLLLRGKENDVKGICDTLGLDYKELQREVDTQVEPVFLDIDADKKELINKDIQGISFINTLKRYDDSSIAKHVLGYLSQADQVGETGIEKFFEGVLKIDDKDTIGVFTDARSNLLQGLGYRIIKSGSTNAGLSVGLTIDYHIQKIAEEVLEENNIKGAAVVEDISNGDIIAMTSKPDFDQNDVEKSLSSPQNELFNRAVASYNLGSIFKIIDLAQAFETGEPIDEEYFCTGSVRIGDKEFKCSSYDKGGHGLVDLKEAFALSCNPYFIEMGVKAGSKNLLDMAAKFGLGGVTGIKDQGIDEASGKLPDVNRHFTQGDVANLSIGQGEIMATPLQIADLAATVANGGIKNKINIVDGVVDGNGNKVKDLRRKEGTRIISKETADRIKALMEEVTNSGTGVKARLEQYGGAAGKTGSAETGEYINGEKVVHAWFTGYFPRLDPKYAVAVFVENGKAGGEAAAPIFEQIAEEIMQKGY